AGDFVWPPPERIAVGPAMTYGYSNGVVLPVAVSAARELVRGTRLVVRGQASWIVCEKICIPEEAPLALTLPVSAGPAQLDAASAPLIGAARRSVAAPTPWPECVTA